MTGTVSPQQLLNAWEQGMAQDSLRRALTLVQLERPTTQRAELEHLSLGQCNQDLVALREQLFGPQLTAVTQCGRCGTRVEFQCVTSSLLPPVKTDPSVAVSFQAGAFDGKCRLPTSADLMALRQLPEGVDARRGLLARCVLEMRRDGVTLPDTEIATLPEEVVQAISERLAEKDPSALIEIALNCPACGQAWTEELDLAAFLWTELHDWARRLLEEIHRLASAYGWREEDILNLSRERRQCYLELIGA